MKIVSQSSDELVLKEGSASGIVVGIVLVIVGLLAEIFLRQSNMVVFWIGLALVAGGVAAILFSSSITVTANKAKGQVVYEKKRLAGSGQNSTFAIADIFRIETRKQWRVDNSSSGNQGSSPPQPVLVAQSVIVFKDGRELALDHQKSSASTSVGGAVLMSGKVPERSLPGDHAA
jgi:hypothetical protein